MFLRSFDFLFKPFRKVRNKVIKVRTKKGRIQMDAKRVKSYGKMGKNKAGKAAGQAKKLGGQAQGAQQQAQGMGQQAQGQMQGAQQQAQGAQAAGAPPAAGAPQMQEGQYPPGTIVKKGWFRKKFICTSCAQQMDPTWDVCPYCVQPEAPAAPAKTQAFMIDPGGSGNSVQLLGWLVPVQGPQRGELFTLAPQSSIGTDPMCTVCLADQYMSSNHAEIKAEGGVWVLKDHGSTNGTYVNDNRVDKQELVDNDFIKFGGSLVKFKSL
jgi:hypothetical protein